MEHFYTHYLGFTVSDRGEGPGGLVFMTRNPNDHHQLVLNPRPSRPASDSPLNHIAFRVDSLDILRAYFSSLSTAPDISVETVSHGNSWSIYFRDPEANRLEIFVDTPWYVSQPCRFAIDLTLSDGEIHQFTENRIRDLPGFEQMKK